MQKINDQQLQQWVEQISLESFGQPFKHKATFNSRLRATGGRYFTRTHHIEISPHQLQAFGLEETEKIIKHELCHYHLHLSGKGYMHRDAEFKMLLAQVGGSRYCKTLPERETKHSSRPIQPFRYKLTCQNCSMVYMRKRKVNTARFVCGKCRGKLLMVMLDN